MSGLISRAAARLGNALQLEDISALRAYRGNRKIVVVGAADVGGTFVRGSGAENGGTVFVAANGVSWLRQFTGRQRPEWYGGLAQALTNCEENTAFELAPMTYSIVGLYKFDTTNLPGVVGNNKKNIKLFGSGQPRPNGAFTALEGGTVIQGLLINMADGFECYNLGIDCGSTVVDTLNGGVWLEGFVPGTTKIYPTPAATRIRGVKWDGITVLMKQPTAVDATKKHAFLVESCENVVGGSCKVYGGYHGFVWKSHGGYIGAVETFGPVGSSYIVKGDAADNAQDLIIGSIRMNSLDGTNAIKAASGVLNGSTRGGSGLGEVRRISIGHISARNVSVPFRTLGQDGFVSNIHVGEIVGEECDGLIDIDATAIRISVGRHRGTKMAGVGVITNAGCREIDIGDGEIIESAQHGYQLIGDIRHGRITAKSNAGWGVNNLGSAVNPELIEGSGNGAGLISTLLPVAFTTLNYTNTAAADFSCVFYGSRVVMDGSLTVGPSAAMGTLPAVFRPRTRRVFPIAGKVGAVMKSGNIVFNIDGTVVISNFPEFETGEIYLGGINYAVTAP